MPKQPMTVNLTLPKELEDYVDQRVACGGHRSAGDYVLELIRAERRLLDRDVFEQELALALEKQDFIPVDEDFWDRLRKDVDQRAARRKSAAGRPSPGGPDASSD